jgi:hypothetical protein
MGMVAVFQCAPAGPKKVWNSAGSVAALQPACIRRAIGPGVGWTILAYDVIQIMQRSICKYNAMAKDGDKLW